MNPAAPPVARRENRVEPHPAAPGGAVRARFDDGRWHFQHGPIDLMLGADGDPAAVDRTIEHAWTRFQGVLAELVSEFELLRMPVQDAHPVKGPVARRMVQACWPHRERFITPMAAVAGAVADELIAFFRADERIRRACINNGGDIALHLTPGESYRVGLYADLGRIERRGRHRLDGDFEVRSDLPVRGVATSGWRGRSFSLGIADSVTVLARNAAEADAAATMVANSVNIEDPAILRRPACDLKDDTDLGGRLVTVSVGTLSADRVGEALDAGASAARELMQRGEIFGAGLWLQGQVRSVGCEDGVI
ncbi:MAG TPA: UPF0280 family protein [Burkholderiales bacterium]|nr:UPF0280 family protein [Burkholderiales bacterium]